MGFLEKGKKYEDKRLEFSKEETGNEQSEDMHESVIPVKQPLDMKIKAAERRSFAQAVRKSTTGSSSGSGTASPGGRPERERER